jgi:hypothetical protein
MNHHNTLICGVMTIHSALKKLEKYQKSIAENPLNANWQPFENGLYPRRYPGNTGVYLGEDCRGKRHFDCESFIAWVLSRALNQSYGKWGFGVP